MNIDTYGIPELLKKLLSPDTHPQAVAYFDLAYSAVLTGNIKLAGAYMSMTEEALHRGVAFTVIDGEKPIHEEYDSRNRAPLEIVS